MVQLTVYPPNTPFDVDGVFGDRDRHAGDGRPAGDLPRARRHRPGGDHRAKIVFDRHGCDVDLVVVFEGVDKIIRVRIGIDIAETFLGRIRGGAAGAEDIDVELFRDRRTALRLRDEDAGARDVEIAAIVDVRGGTLGVVFDSSPTAPSSWPVSSVKPVTSVKTAVSPS